MPEETVTSTIDEIVKEAERQTAAALHNQETNEPALSLDNDDDVAQPADTELPDPTATEDPAEEEPEASEPTASNEEEESTSPDEESQTMPQKELMVVSLERRQQERSQVAKNILFRKVDGLDKQLKEHPDQERQILSSEGARRLHSLGNLMRLDKTGNYVTIDADGNKRKGIDLSTGHPIIAKHEGKSWRIVGIQGRKDREFICHVRSTDDVTESTIPLPDAAVVTAYLTAERDDILKEFAGAEQKILNGYVTEQQGKDLSETDEANNNDLIKEAASSTGMLLSEDILAGLSHREQTPENSKQNEEIEKLLDGKNIVDAETATQVLNILGCNPEKMEAEIENVNQEIARQQEILAQHPDDEDAQAALIKLNQQISIYQAAQKTLEAGGNFAAFFNKVDDGKTDLETANAVKQAWREGDREKLIEIAVASMATEGLSEAELEQKREELRSLLSGVGHGLGVMLALLFNALASDEAKSMLKSLK